MNALELWHFARRRGACGGALDFIDSDQFSADDDLYTVLLALPLHRIGWFCWLLASPNTMRDSELGINLRKMTQDFLDNTESIRSALAKEIGRIPTDTRNYYEQLIPVRAEYENANADIWSSFKESIKEPFLEWAEKAK